MVLSDEQILQKFSEMGNRVEIAEVVKELFEQGDEAIWMKTDLTRDEVRLLTRIKMIGEMKNLPLWARAAEYYAKLVLSTDRKSRKEILDAIRGYNQSYSFFDRLRGRGRDQ